MSKMSRICGSTYNYARVSLLILVVISSGICLSVVPSDEDLENKIRIELLKDHNEIRANYGLSPLRNNKTLETFSSYWVTYLWGIGTMFHSHNPKYGENIAWMMNDNANYDYIGLSNDLFNLWYREIDWFMDGKIPNISTNGQEAGHISQILWNTTTDVGCTVYGGNSNYFLVCNYWPPGNIIGRRAF